MTNQEKIADLLTKQPLYKNVEVDIDFLSGPNDLAHLPFSFFCPNEKSHQTFQLELEPTKFINGLGGKLTPDDFKGRFESFDEESKTYNYNQHYSAKCQHCKKYRVEFLLQIKTNKSIPLNSNYLNNQEYIYPIQIVKKVGQYPPYEITPEKFIVNYLNDEDQENYKKALICLSQKYGIAAYAYLRRIVENEIIRIIEDISKLDFPDAERVQELFAAYQQNHQMANLIEGIYQYLPSSLKSLGNNPIKVLHSQLSGGIHNFSEDECFEKSELIDTLLKFVIKKINEEQSDVLKVREAMKKLTI